MRKLLLIICILLAIPHVAGAQWKLLNTFPAAVSAIYIQPGEGTFGFVGLTNGEVYRTTNAGITWQLVNTRSQPVEFAFENDSVGYYAGVNACYRTTDAGTTWIYGAPAYGGTGTSIWYLAESQRVHYTTTDWRYESSDHGSTWPHEFLGITGLDMMTRLIGVGASYSPYGMYDPYIWITKTGGASWSSSRLGLHGWQTATSRCTGKCFLIQDQSGGLFVSSDTGYTWNFTANLPPNPTGCLRSDGKRLYAQTTAGFFVSSDWGVTWQEIGGKTHVKNGLQTRFCVVNSNIYAGDGAGALYVDTEFAISPIGLKPDSLHLFSTFSTCADTVFNLQLQNAECLSTDVLSIEYDAGVFSSDAAQFPLTLNSAGTPVHVHFSNPKVRGSYTANANVHYVQHTGEGDRQGVATVRIRMDVKGERVEFPSRSVTVPSLCIAHDSSFVIRNYACDGVTLDSASLSGLNVVGVMPGQFPIVIEGGLQRTLSINVNTPSRISDRILDLKLHFNSNSGPFDTSMKILFNVQSDVRASVIGNGNFGEGLTGSHITQKIRIANPGCQPMELHSAAIQNGNNFSFDSLRSLPILLQPSDSVEIVLSFLPTGVGEFSDLLRLSLNIGGVARDTLFELKGTGIDKPLSVTSPVIAPLDFVLAPNPSKNGVSLLFSEAVHKQIEIEIYNSAGAQVYHQEKPVVTSLFVPLAGFSPGSYIVRVRSGNEVIMKQLEVIR